MGLEAVSWTGYALYDRGLHGYTDGYMDCLTTAGLHGLVELDNLDPLDHHSMDYLEHLDERGLHGLHGMDYLDYMGSLERHRDYLAAPNQLTTEPPTYDRNHLTT